MVYLGWPGVGGSLFGGVCGVVRGISWVGGVRRFWMKVYLGWVVLIF